MRLNDIMHIWHDIGRYNIQLSLGSIVDSDQRRAAYTQGLKPISHGTSEVKPSKVGLTLGWVTFLAPTF
jgi:hypothetical protein